MNPGLSSLAGRQLLTLRQLVTRGTHTAGSVTRGVAVEAGVLLARVVMYPWSALTEQVRPGGPHDCYRTDDLSPTERGLVIVDVHTAGTPVLLVHGFADNRSVFAVLDRALRRHGFGVVYSVNYGVRTALTGDVPSVARELGREVERICEATGAERVHVVGHSLGGLVARYYVQRLGGDARVHTLVTLGAPHHGTMAAYLLPAPVLHQLRPHSELMAELAAPSPRCRTRFVAVWSELDEWIVPQRNARLDHPDLLVTHHRLGDVGHLSLPVDPRAVHTVVSALAPHTSAA
ncbi:MAG: esterase/lipase family protein [Pseudonocardiaceae bacterium]